MAHSKRLQEVLDDPDGVLSGVSGNKASIRVGVGGGELSAATILRIKSGMFGEEENVRQLGRAYAPELVERFRERMVADLGEPSADTEDAWREHAAQWLAYLANPRWANANPAQSAGSIDADNLADQVASRTAAIISGAQHFQEGIWKLQQRFNRPVPVWFGGGKATLTVEEADNLLADIEKDLIAEEKEQRKGQ